ncbi:NitT/TauT family transport system permease protein [Halarchaeum solikamskense]|uniref:ABC transporter permease n=1 Tax=Halarchaeum nitratireducens TaxID=489913 RepID=UPI001B3ABAAF|nr:NitT/TauT family transport system permease protein [Halarchaeum solikamskense]
MSDTRVLTDRRRRVLLRVASVVALLLAWYAYTTAARTLLASPVAVAASFVEHFVVTGTLRRAIADALVHAALGYALAVAVGVPVGFALGLSERLAAAYDPAVDALYAAPVVALAPLFVVWFGLTPLAKTVLVFLFAVFVIVVTTETGVRETDRGAVDAARVFGAGPRVVYGEVYLRSALPSILTGLRLGAGRAIRGMVAAELFLYAGDLGSYLIDTAATFRMADSLAGVLALSLTGVVAMALVAALGRAATRSGS